MRPDYLISIPLGVLVMGCTGDQSALDPTGGEAHRIALLSWVLFSFCGGVFLSVIGIASVALYGSVRWRSIFACNKAIFICGLLFPAMSLTALLGYSVAVMGMGAGVLKSDRIRISVVGERWWWRVTYFAVDGRRIESANELRLPVGENVSVELTSADVIHSFWVPNLAGKLDMIPGRTNILTLHVDEPGISRGQCAEFCGGPHAFMSFYVIALDADEFDDWLTRESLPANRATGQEAELGQRLFETSGCGACHTIRGTSAAGLIGPDLTHVGSRHSLAAATLPNSPDAFRRWIAEGQHVKPENLMPTYRIFSDAELLGLSSYLGQLK